MLRAAGMKNVTSGEQEHVPGDAIHEMGGARMGADPRFGIRTEEDPARRDRDGARARPGQQFAPAAGLLVRDDHGVAIDAHLRGAQPGDGFVGWRSGAIADLEKEGSAFLGGHG